MDDKQFEIRLTARVPYENRTQEQEIAHRFFNNFPVNKYLKVENGKGEMIEITIKEIHLAKLETAWCYEIFADTKVTNDAVCYIGYF